MDGFDGGGWMNEVLCLRVCWMAGIRQIISQAMDRPLSMADEGKGIIRGCILKDGRDHLLGMGLFLHLRCEDETRDGGWPTPMGHRSEGDRYSTSVHFWFFFEFFSDRLSIS